MQLWSNTSMVNRHIFTVRPTLERIKNTEKNDNLMEYSSYVTKSGYRDSRGASECPLQRRGQYFNQILTEQGNGHEYPIEDTQCTFD